MTDVPKSCLSCPSFSNNHQTMQLMKKSVGAGTCSRYGNVLGKPGIKAVQEEKLAVLFAEKCPSYGQPRPTHQLEYRLQVALPDPATIGVTQYEPEKVTSCAMCTHFVRDDAVARELGWTVGACAARGKLILPTRQSIEARTCEVRSLGQPRHSTEGMTLLPEFDDAFNMAYDPVKQFFKAKQAGLVDPTEWATDKPVTADDDTSGIRAWRKIEDKDSGNLVYLPIYKREHFTPEQQDQIPTTGDDEYPEDYVDHNKAIYKVAVAWTALDETPALWGPAGVGKTEFFRHMAWLMQLPFIRISITATTELDDLAGKMHFSKETGTYFKLGRLPKAWTEPGVVCLDEPNVGQPDVWQFIRPLTDNSKQLVLDQNEGERYPRHDDCYLGMAMNPAWDPKNVGATELGDADGSRLSHINMELPPAALEREIIRTRVSKDGWDIDNPRLDLLMGVAVDIRALCDDEELPITWGIRDQLKVARALRWFDTVTSYCLARADALEPQAREALLTVVRSHVPS